MGRPAVRQTVPKSIRLVRFGSLKIKKMVKSKKAESFVAIGSFFAAVALAFTSLIISPKHDIEAGVLMMCAQFLMLTATIFGLDYKLGQAGLIRKGGIEND